ncbi:MAG: hypothetical protein ACLSBB_13165 [Ruthenibacterium lactatiformans]
MKLEQEIARNVEESLRTRGEVLALIGGYKTRAKTRCWCCIT